MSATDELRRLLDELGVEWWGSRYGEQVVFQVGEVKWFANDGCRDGMLELSTILITPEQAIAATLGDVDKGIPQGDGGNLDQAQADWMRYMPDGWDGTQPTLGCGKLTADDVRASIESRFDFDLWVPNARWQAIADELNAALGGGECELEYIDTYEYSNGDEDYLCKCSKCGRTSWEPAHNLPKFCGGCGRKVK